MKTNNTPAMNEDVKAAYDRLLQCVKGSLNVISEDSGVGSVITITGQHTSGHDLKMVISMVQNNTLMDMIKYSGERLPDYMLSMYVNNAVAFRHTNETNDVTFEDIKLIVRGVQDIIKKENRFDKQDAYNFLYPVQ